MVQMLRGHVVSLCESLGFKTASKWNKARMAEKLVEISELAGGDGEVGVELEDEDQKELLQKIIKAGGKVDVVQVLDDEENEEAVESKDERSLTAEGDEEDYEEVENEEAAKINAEINKAVKGKKSKTVGEKGAKTPKAEKAVDALGNRVGSQGAQINACLSKKNKTIAQIAEETKLTAGRVNGHIKYLEGKGLVVLSDKGVALK